MYGTLLRSVFSRSMLFPIPLWFMEGLAEYYSSGYDRSGEMFMRDAAVFDYLIRSRLYRRLHGVQIGTGGHLLSERNVRTRQGHRDHGRHPQPARLDQHGVGELARDFFRGAEPRLEEGDAEALLAALCGQEGARGVRKTAHRSREEAQRDEHETGVLAGRPVRRVLLGSQGARRHLPHERRDRPRREAAHFGDDVDEVRVDPEHEFESHVQPRRHADRLRREVARRRQAVHRARARAAKSSTRFRSPSISSSARRGPRPETRSPSSAWSGGRPICISTTLRARSSPGSRKTRTTKRLPRGFPTGRGSPTPVPPRPRFSPCSRPTAPAS